MSVIFLAGVHGVGKGYLGAPAAKALGITHCTASQLIREEKGLATWGLDKRGRLRKRTAKYVKQVAMAVAA